MATGLLLLGACSKNKDEGTGKASTGNKPAPSAVNKPDAKAKTKPKESKPGGAKASALKAASAKQKAKHADWAQVRQAVSASKKAVASKKKPADIPRPKARAFLAPKLPKIKASGFRVAHEEAENPRQEALRKAFVEQRVFEDAVAQLNRRLRIKGIIEVQMAACGEPNAFYDDGRPQEEGGEATTPRIIMCYELMTHFFDLYSATTKDPVELGMKVVGNVYFTFFHELGHALRHNLDLPITGREEDAVDQLATLLLLQMGEQGVLAALVTAEGFGLQQAEDGDDGEELALWGEHSMDGQRMYDTLCLIYGSDPKQFADMADDDALPQERAERCEGDFKQVAKAWNKLLSPHVVGGKPLGVAMAATTKVASAVAKAPEAPDRPTDAGTSPTCEAVAQAFADRTEDAMTGGKEPTEEQHDELDLLFNGAVNDCETDNWPAAMRTCVTGAKDFKALEGCFEE